MSDVEATGSPCVVIRDNDYYGGDIKVVQGQSWAGRISIIWEAWGDYGSTSITLSTEEIGKLIDALNDLKDIPEPPSLPSNLTIKTWTVNADGTSLAPPSPDTEPEENTRK